MRHPNYAVTIAETFLLPLVFADAAVAVIFGCVWSAVLYYKILLEDAALAERRGEDAPHEQQHWRLPDDRGRDRARGGRACNIGW